MKKSPFDVVCGTIISLVETDEMIAKLIFQKLSESPVYPTLKERNVDPFSPDTDDAFLSWRVSFTEDAFRSYPSMASVILDWIRVSEKRIDRI